MTTKLHLEQHRAGINPLAEPVTLQAGTFAVTFPPGSLKKTTQGCARARHGMAVRPRWHGRLQVSVKVWILLPAPVASA
jgi:hypothetical protein